MLESVLSQERDVQKNIGGEKYAVTLAPAFFPFNRIGLQPGFQFRLNDSWAVITEFSVPVTKSSDKGDNYQKMQLIKLASELKYYPKKLSDRFYSIQIGYMQRNFIDSDSGKYHNPGAINEIGYSRLTIKSPVYFFAIKCGSEEVQWRKVFLDCFLGVGVRIIPTKYNSEGAYVAGQWDPPVDNIAWMAPIAAWEYDKTCIRPHFTLGFRIGGKF